MISKISKFKIKTGCVCLMTQCDCTDCTTRAGVSNQFPECAWLSCPLAGHVHEGWQWCSNGFGNSEIYLYVSIVYLYTYTHTHVYIYINSYIQYIYKTYVCVYI